MKTILGISAFYHDSAAGLVRGGEIIAAAQEERFTRIKHTPEFPEHAIRYCLEESGCTIDELDAIVFYDKPLLKFERLLETYYAFAPKGLRSFLNAIPVWVREKMFLKKMIYDGLREIGDYDKKNLNLLFTEHHLSHAASAFFASPFDEAAILTIDGVGEWATATIGKGAGNKISFSAEMEFPHSVGLLYSAFTYYLGFRVNSGEYKLMGLAPYGNPESKETQEFIKFISNNLIDIKDDGSVWLNQDYFSYATGLRMVRDKKWEELFGFPRRNPDLKTEQHHCNLAYAIQNVTEKVVLKMAEEAKRQTGSSNLCMAGGVALNCVANGLLVKEEIFDHVFVQPAAGDAGGALGAALAANYIYFGKPRNTDGRDDLMKGSLLGPEYSDKEIRLMNLRNKAVGEKFNSYQEICTRVATELAEGKIVGWFQGRMEYGPRALGNRSILADPRNTEMQKRLNLKIKYRESFRPFAPSVLREKTEDYFDLSISSPYMLLTAPLKEEKRLPVPENYACLPMIEKLYHQRSILQTITHVDFSARLQTVDEKTNPRYAALLRSFGEKTGCAVLVNTSFNVRGEPIVCTPNDAWRCFMATEMDILVIGNYHYQKEKQPEQENKAKWLTSFQLD